MAELLSFMPSRIINSFFDNHFIPAFQLYHISMWPLTEIFMLAYMGGIKQISILVMLTGAVLFHDFRWCRINPRIEVLCRGDTALRTKLETLSKTLVTIVNHRIPPIKNATVFFSGRAFSLPEPQSKADDLNLPYFILCLLTNYLINT